MVNDSSILLTVRGIFYYVIAINLLYVNVLSMVKVTYDLFLASDNKLVSILFLLDRSAAFDYINHNILLHRHEHVTGIRKVGKALRWLKYYL